MSSAYHIIILIATIMEFIRVCSQIYHNESVMYIYKYNGIKYTLWNFKIDGLLLMILVEISSIITLIIDKNREYYCFGLSNVYRHRLLQISQHQERWNRNSALLNAANNGMIYDICQENLCSYVTIFIFIFLLF